MNTFNFNTFYILESLGDDDQKTGKELYETLMVWLQDAHPSLHIHYVPIRNKREFFLFFDRLYNDIEEHQNSPLIHFEIHGAADHSGLILANQEAVSFDEFGPYLRKINEACGCNLFISLAVC